MCTYNTILSRDTIKGFRRKSIDFCKSVSHVFNINITLLLLSYRCVVAVCVLWLFLAVPWVALQCVIMVFPDHTHLLFENTINV